MSPPQTDNARFYFKKIPKLPNKNVLLSVGRGLHRESVMAKRKPNAAFMKPVTPDAALAAVVGSKPLPRTELTKKLWVYIKANNLQDPKKKTQINADDKLKAVYDGKKSVSMFEMTKLVSGHVTK